MDWGAQGQWDQYSLLTAFHPDTVNPDRFFVILERIIKEPALYIDILELMYICLSLGFEGPYRTPASLPEQYQADQYNNLQFERVIQGLYQQIRAYRGDFPKNLSPYLIRPIPASRKSNKAASLGWTLLFTSCFALLIMSGLGYSLGTMITQINQDLKQIGKSSFYEAH
jgi:type VI secretion system protein ImpK